MSETKESKLTAAQKSRIERNRARALILRQAKLVPYKTGEDCKESIIKVQGTKFVDSGGGFLIEQPLDCSAKLTSALEPGESKDTLNEESEAIAIPVEYEECLECGDKYAESFLFSNFGYSVCDRCRQPDEKHSLITRTEAKAEYLLKDCDFDKREPALRFIRRKNPHNVRWGEMKLYLHLQVEQRAMDVWGSEEELMRQHENREVKREVGKIKRYNKQMKQLRMEVRSSLYTKQTKGPHVHDFGPDTYNEEEDTYTHSCTTCPYTETYEKL